MTAPTKLYYTPYHGWSSNGLYKTLGTARNALSNRLSWQLNSRNGLASGPHTILVAEDIEWKIQDSIPVGTTYEKLPWKDKSKVTAARMRAKAAALLAEAEALDPQVQPFVPAGEISHDMFTKLVAR